MKSRNPIKIGQIENFGIENVEGLEDRLSSLESNNDNTSLKYKNVILSNTQINEIATGIGTSTIVPPPAAGKVIDIDRVVVEYYLDWQGLQNPVVFNGISGCVVGIDNNDLIEKGHSFNISNNIHGFFKPKSFTMNQVVNTPLPIEDINFDNNRVMIKIDIRESAYEMLGAGTSHLNIHVYYRVYSNSGYRL